MGRRYSHLPRRLSLLGPVMVKYSRQLSPYDNVLVDLFLTRRPLTELKLLYFLVTEINGTRSLKGVKVSVPRFVREKHRVTLGCVYDLEDAPLYSVKWYRDSNEFYRYIPKEAPPTRVFPQRGLHVDVSTNYVTFCIKIVENINKNIRRKCLSRCNKTST